MRDSTPLALATFPMHGQHKLVREGYRTRDGHLIEWFGRLLADSGAVGVVSRPEPAILNRGYDRARAAKNTRPIDTRPMTLPDPFNRRKWWVTSSTKYPLHDLPYAPAAVTWNPFVFCHPRFETYMDNRPIAIDLLDDWSLHFAFTGIRAQVEEAYRRAFERADLVYANAEGTHGLAQRFGRSDAVLIPNGVDRERFDQRSTAAGPTTVGYIGKIGHRVDLDLVLDTARALPRWRFVFAGPILDSEYRAPLEQQENIELLGDVHYESIPALLQSFDIGWVPHSVGTNEVGGDAIKIYEYNAAGLPVLSTPIAGAGKRGIEDVFVAPPAEHQGALRRLAGDAGERVPRVSPSLPDSSAWRSKAARILRDLGLEPGEPFDQHPGEGAESS